MTGKRRIVVCVAAVVAAGVLRAPVVVCAQSDNAPAFDTKAYRHYARRGSIQLGGTLSVALPNGDSRSRAGEVVIAVPESAYTQWWLHTSSARMRDGGDFDITPPPILSPYAHTAVTQADGTFAFTDLPPGEYILRGVLHVGFPRAVLVQHAVPIPGTDGRTYYATETDQETVTDRTTVLLDSFPVHVSRALTGTVAFRISARHDALAKVNSTLAAPPPAAR